MAKQKQPPKRAGAFNPDALGALGPSAQFFIQLAMELLGVIELLEGLTMVANNPNVDGEVKKLYAVYYELWKAAAAEASIETPEIVRFITETRSTGEGVRA